MEQYLATAQTITCQHVDPSRMALTLGGVVTDCPGSDNSTSPHHNDFSPDEKLFLMRFDMSWQCSMDLMSY